MRGCLKSAFRRQRIVDGKACLRGGGVVAELALCFRRSRDSATRDHAALCFGCCACAVSAGNTTARVALTAARTRRRYLQLLSTFRATDEIHDWTVRITAESGSAKQNDEETNKDQ